MTLKTLRCILLLILLTTLSFPWTPAHVVVGQSPHTPETLLFPDLPSITLSPTPTAVPLPPQPEMPKQFLARLTANGDPQALADFLQELREQDQIGDFRWVEESRAFLITGEKGLSLVIARPEVREIIEATPETLALPPLQEETPPAGQPEITPPAAPSAQAEPPGPDETPQEPKDIYLVRLVAPESPTEVGMAYSRLTFELEYLHQQGQIGAHEWLPKANAVQVEVIVPQAIDFMRALSDVADVLPRTEETLSQMQEEYRAALRTLDRDADDLSTIRITDYTPTTPRAEARLYSNYLYLSGNNSASTVVTLTTSTGTLKNDPTQTSVNYDWYWGGCWASVYLRDTNYNAVAMTPGDILYVAQSGQTPFSMTIPLLTAHADAAANTVSGQAPPNVASTDPNNPPVVRVSVYSSQYVTTTAAGEYLATQVGDFSAGASGEIRYYDERGNQTYLPFRAPLVSVRGSDGYSSEQRVAGYAPPGNLAVTIELWRGSTLMATWSGTADSDGYFSAYLSESIAAGDEVRVAAGDWSATVHVPMFTAESIPEADMVIGQTDATVVTTTYDLPQTLAVWPQTYYDGNYDARKRVQPDAGGVFTATNPFERYDGWSGWEDVMIDIRPGDAGHLRYVDAAGNRTYFRFKAPLAPPVLYARGWGSDSSYNASDTLGGYITGFCSSEDGYGTAVLRSAGGTIKAQVNNINACPSIYVDFDVPIEGGDVISATFGNLTTVMTVPRFSVTVDPDTDTIVGQTDATVVTTTYDLPQTLAVWPQTYSDDDYYARKRVQPDAGGVFTATNPFERYGSDVTIDIRPDDAGHLRYVDADGNRTYAGFTAPRLHVRGDSSGYRADNYVYVQGNPGQSVTVMLKRGGTTVATATGQLADYGDAGVYLTDEYGAPVLIQAGDVIEAVLSGQTISAAVPTLTAVPNTATGIVSGIAPANITDTGSGNPHTLQVYRSRNGIYRQVTTDATGAYSADLSAEGGLRPGDSGWLRYVNLSGYYIYDNYWIPIIYVRGYESGYQAENYVSGYIAETGALITVTLEREGAVVARVYARSGASDGYFSVYLRDGYGYNADILGGDTVRVQTAGETMTILVPRFSAVSDPLTDRITGSTDAVVTSQTPDMTQTLAIWPTSTSSYYWEYGKHVMPAGGAFTASNPFYYSADPTNSPTTLDWGYGAQGHARYINAEGNRVYMRIQAPIKPEVHVRSYYNDQRYYAENSVGGRVEGFCGYGTVTLKDSAGRVKAQTTSAWACSSLYAFLYDAAGNPASILPGDRVEATFGGTTTVVQIPDFNVTSDPVNDRLTGTTNAVVGAGTVTQTLALWPTSWYDYDEGKRVTVNVGGAFTATNPFYRYADPGYSSVTLDWGIGAGGHLRYVDADGNRVYARIKAHTPQAVLILRGNYWEDRYVADNYVSGYIPGFCGEGTVTVRDGSSVLKGQWRRVRACNDLALYLYGEDGAAVNLSAGDTVSAVFGATTVAVTVPELTAETDHINSRVTGRTNATVSTTTYGMTQTLAVWPTSYYDSDYGKHVQPTNGVFTATNPFYWNANPARGQTTLSWSATSVGHLRYVDGVWNRVYARLYRPDVFLYVHQYYSSDSYGYDSEYVLSGYVPGFCGYGSIALKNAAGTLKAQRTNVYACNNFYGLYFDNAGSPVPIEAGDRLEASFGGLTKTLTVPYLTARADAALDRVTGTTNADMRNGATLTVYPTSAWYEYYDYPYKRVQPDASGAFTATNPFYYYGSSTTWVDIREGDQGHVRYTTPSGDRVQYRFMAEYPTPRVWVWKDGYYTYGYSFPHYVSITATLRRGGNVLASGQARTDGIGYFYVYFRDAANNYVYIREGDTVRVEAAGLAPIEVPVVRLTAQADPEQDAVWGYGPVNAQVTVGNSSQPTPTDANGAYRADLRGLNDLRPGNSYSVSYRNPDGHTVYISQYVGPQINAVLHSNYVWAYGVPSGAVVTATLKAGATVKGTASANSYSGYISARLLDAAGNPAIIAPGDTLEVDLGGGNVIALPIVSLTAQVNPATGQVSGTGPANAWLGVDVDAYSPDRSVKTDGAGGWAMQVLDFYGWTDTHVRVRHTNAQGHQVWLYTRVRPPVVYVRGTDTGFAYTSDRTVAGYADGYALVNLRLLRSGVVVEQQNVLAQSYGWYNTTFTETIKAGDQVVVQWMPRAPITVTVPPLAASANVGSSSVSGVGPANATIGVRANGYAQSATTSSGGTFEVGMPLVTGREYIYLNYQMPEGHWIHARAGMGNRIFLPLVVRNR